MTTEVDLDSFDPLSEAVQQCPFPHYAAMRAERPVLRLDGAGIGRPGEDVFCVSRHVDVLAVLHDPRTFSSRFGTPAAKPSAELRAALAELYADGWPNVSTMLTEDPPSHTRYRQLVAKAFTPKRVKLLEPEIRAICEDLVDGFDGARQIEFVGQFGVPLPVRAVAAVLDVPDDRQAEFKQWADASVAAIGRSISDQARLDAERLIVEQQHWFAEQIEDRMRAPRDDFLTDLLNARLSPEDGIEGEPLTMAEMLSIIRQIQVAGSETTTSLLADLMVQLIERPEAWRAVKDEPSRIPQVIEEALRIASPNQGMFRIATRDCEVGGVAIPAGSTLWVMFGSANRDESVFEHAEDFDPNRADLFQHVAFGKGPHYCLGAALARLEARVAVETLVARLEEIALAPGAALRYAPSFILRGLERLDLEVSYP